MARFERRGQVFEITSSDARYTVEQRERLKDGWTRVCDPRCEVPFGTEPINAMLDEALRSDPEDVGAALVYADWLEQQGHPRGALIAVQHRLALSPHDPQLIEAERRIVDEAGDALLSKALLAHLAIYRNPRDPVEIAPSRNLFGGGQLTFDHGFIREARLAIDARGGDEDLVWELLRHPSARVLADLGVRVQPPRDMALVVALLVHGPRPPLRALSLTTLRAQSTVDLAGLDEAFPALAELKIGIPQVRFGDLHLPALRRLHVQAQQHDLGRILAGAPWPALEELTMIGAPEQLAPAFERPVFPVLRSVLLAASQYGLLLCRMLVRSPAAATLEALYITDTKLEPEAVTMLVENRAKFPRLHTFDVGKQRTDLLDRLREAGYPL